MVYHVSYNWDEMVYPISYNWDEMVYPVSYNWDEMVYPISYNWDEMVYPISYNLDEMVYPISYNLDRAGPIPMMDKNKKNTRLDGRTVTVSARATRAARRSSQDPNSGVGGLNEEHVVEPEQSQEDNGKRKWLKRPRTFDWKLTAPAPGWPLSTDLLRGYRGHVACYIWEKNIERGCLVIQSRTHAIDLFRFEPRDAWYLLVKSTGLGHLRECMFPHHNAPLISAFVERWHPETNSFHLPFGEMTITLHDVSLILGLPINGLAINHPMQQKESRNSLFSFIGKLLNIDTKEIEFEHAHGGIKLSKIRETLMDPKNEYGADDLARGFLVTLLGSTLFIDKIVDRASTLLFPLVRDLVSVKSYSWASAALAYLYRELGKATRAETKQLAGSSTLLEIIYFLHLNIV
ncbi:protein MAIN-LIKE 1-like [Beta vulgaris subsp. vulgaris]|uniref:protein MAIN-LIKE 1-like n=1 Tax=Beta vulgaris subsp. vulgaris TaxID=3555 RepID=UPI00254988F1|nr:protein MAIN-LIKE 1-like [Beta vulgaris subsp. vulgaris]